MNRRSFLKFLVGAPAVALIPTPNLEHLDELVAPVADPLPSVTHGPYTLSAWVRAVDSKVWTRVTQSFDEKAGQLMSAKSATDPLVLPLLRAMAEPALVLPTNDRSLTRTEQMMEDIGFGSHRWVMNQHTTSSGKQFLITLPSLYWMPKEEPLSLSAHNYIIAPRGYLLPL